VAELDDEVGELFLMEEEVPAATLRAAIRRQTISLSLVPVLMGSAFKNKGVQPLLDAVVQFLPSPLEKPNVALDLERGEEEVGLDCRPDAPLVALAFKLEESRFGQITYTRVYQGTLRKGDNVLNTSTGKKLKVPRLARMHANDMQDVEVLHAGDVGAMFGIECSSMDTFTDGSVQLAMRSMFVPQPVMSITVKPKDSAGQAKFAKAISKFTKEDPTLRVGLDEKTSATILSGMGELHLDVYVERIRREYGVELTMGTPSVNYKESITKRKEFNYLHKKQTGGSGQYARVVGFIEPLETEADGGTSAEYVFENHVVGTNIPPEFIPSCEKGAAEAGGKGPLTGHGLQGMRVVLQDGQTHPVDSSDQAFRTAMASAVRGAVLAAKPVVLEPLMAVEVVAPTEFQGTIIANLNKRMGLIQATDSSEDGSGVVIKADVPLRNMFGYSTDLRSSTQGKGEYTMEYKMHSPIPRDEQDKLIKAHQQESESG